jgi:hypothetical protein
LLNTKIVRILLNKKIYPVGMVAEKDDEVALGTYTSSLAIMEKLKNGECFY